MKNIKQIIFFCLFLFFSVSSVYAQISEIDSLQNELKNVQDDSIKADILNKLCKHNVYINSDKALDYANEAFNIAKKLKDKHLTGLTLNNYGLIYYSKSDYVSAIEKLILAVDIFIESDNKSELANSYYLLGSVYHIQGNYEKSTEYFFLSLKLYEELGDNSDTADFYNIIGIVFLEQEYYDKAEKFFKKSAKLHKKLNDKTGLAYAINNLGIVYYKTQQYEIALKYFKETDEINKELNDIKLVAESYKNIGLIYFETGQYKKADQFFNKSLKIKKELKDKDGISSVLTSLADLKIKQNLTDSAEIYALKAYKIYKKLNANYNLSEITYTLSQIYYLKNDYKTAYEFSQEHITLNDSIFNKEKAEIINEIETKYETAKKEEEITNLNLEKELQKSVIRRQRITTIAVIVSLILFIFLSIVAYRGYILKKRASNLLSEQNKRIEEQKHEIISQNNELANQTKKLKELDKIKSNFFANISHEFRTPLTLIAGPVEQLIEKNSYPEIKPDLEMVYRHSKRLKQLIDQLLDISKIERGALQLQVVKDDLKAFTGTLVSSFHSFAEENKIDLQFESEENELFCLFDKDKIEKIIGNLVTNAVKFTPSGGKVVIRLKTKDKKANIEVEDTGKGISKDNQKLIFERFYRSEEHNSIGGTGIGLSLVKELVNLHRGDIFVESVEGKGTKFMVSLHISENMYSSDEIVSETPEFIPKKDTYIEKSKHDEIIIQKNTDNKKKNILIVEDNADMRKYITDNLSEYNIELAENGKIGIEKAISSNPDLIISDVMMPEKNGYELTKELKNNNETSHIPIILLTAKASEESVIEGLSSEADDYVKKPFSVNELKARVANLIKIREKLIEKFQKSITVNPSEITTTSVDEEFLQKALQIVENNISESEFGTEKFTKEIGISRTALHRKLKALTGQSTTEFIRIIRLKRAAQLIKQNVGNITEIAYDTGFTNLSYFTKCFKEIFSVAPSDYEQL